MIIWGYFYWGCYISSVHLWKVINRLDVSYKRHGDQITLLSDLLLEGNWKVILEIINIPKANNVSSANVKKICNGLKNRCLLPDNNPSSSESFIPARGLLVDRLIYQAYFLIINPDTHRHSIFFMLLIPDTDVMTMHPYLLSFCTLVTVTRSSAVNISLSLGHRFSLANYIILPFMLYIIL